MKKPQVSVIIPAFNCAKYISKSIDSALEQNVSLEILVINDCSTDHLDEVMEKYKANPVVFYVKNEKNIGAAETRNRGVHLARGQYIAFLDGDDYWEHNKLKKQLKIMRNENYVLCTTARELMTPEGDLTGRVIPVKEEITYDELLKHNSINCSSVVLQRDVAKEFPMHHADSHEDYIMWLEILKKYKKACGINEPLLKYRLSNKGKSGNKIKSAKMTFMVYRYMGFGVLKSIICFFNYAVHGIRKYFL
ncbi:MAG: glycosyltransferase family 2 protein [Lachnospiraceae bacterium]|nr:glycosyltransferase family 2 protein [Lachnospiraceae bacterium]